MFNVKIFVTYKESILDPQGEAIKTALHRMDYTNVNQVVQGKYFEMQIKHNGQDINEEVDQICDQLLANVNTESYRFEISELVEG